MGYHPQYVPVSGRILHSNHKGYNHNYQYYHPQFINMISKLIIIIIENIVHSTVSEGCYMELVVYHYCYCYYYCYYYYYILL
jgi:hypothetical protein